MFSKESLQKILIAMVIIISGSIGVVYSDDAILGGTAKTVYPIYSADIRMLSEKIDLAVDGDRTKVSCEFVFSNEGKAAEILMGFPEEIGRADFSDNTRVYDFKAMVKGKYLEVSRKKGGKPAESEIGELVYPYWHTFKVKFQKNEKITVKNTYWVYNTYDSTSAWTVRYILKTGAVWKGKIDRIDINMKINGFMPYFEYNTNMADESYRANEITPYGTFTWHMENVEPDKDIAVYYKACFDRDLRNQSIGAESFWKRFYAMDYKNALKYVPELEKAISKQPDDIFSQNAILAIAAAYYYNKDYVRADKYLERYGGSENVVQYYKALIYKNQKEYKKMKQCLDIIIRTQNQNSGDEDLLVKWAKQKYQIYGKY